MWCTRRSGIGSKWADEFRSTWRSVDLRWRAASKHSAAFTLSMDDFRNPLTEPNVPYDEYEQNVDVQEAELFNFFCNAWSALETVTYALYFLGARKFDAEEAARLKPSTVSKFFANGFPSASLTKTMKRMVGSNEFSTIKVARDTLSHRGTPGRHSYACDEAILESAKMDPNASADARHAVETHGLILLPLPQGKSLPINLKTTATHLKWLEKSLCALSDDALLFFRQHYPYR
jgi:hypothetical protein